MVLTLGLEACERRKREVTAVITHNIHDTASKQVKLQMNRCYKLLQTEPATLVFCSTFILLLHLHCLSVMSGRYKKCDA